MFGNDNSRQKNALALHSHGLRDLRPQLGELPNAARLGDGRCATGTTLAGYRDHVGNVCGSARDHLGDFPMATTESPQTAVKPTEMCDYRETVGNPPIYGGSKRGTTLPQICRTRANHLNDLGPTQMTFPIAAILEVGTFLRFTGCLRFL